MGKKSGKSTDTVLSKIRKALVGLLRAAKNGYVGLYKRARWYGKAGILLATFLVCLILFLVMVDTNFLWLFGKSPSMHTIANPVQAEASHIYSADGKLMGHYFRENRVPVTYEEISPTLIKTLVCTEDERFYDHFGIDFKAVFAALKDMTQGNARGASTITQQLVKNMFKTRTEYSTGLLGYIPGVKMGIMKTKEWISAVKLEIFYSKREILTMYLNTVDFGSNSYGIKTASKTFFKTTPQELTIEQGATLIGLLKATTYYSPRLNPENSLQRRNVVLRNMLSHGIISRAECDSLSRLPIQLHYSVNQNYEGPALYFREAVASELNKWCNENDIDLYADGLKIYTTVDSRMQKYAEEAVHRQMKVVQQNFNAHWGSTNPWQDSRRREIVGFIEGIARNTSYYKVLQEKYGNDPDSIDYYMNLPHKVKLFDYETGSREVMISTMDSIRYMEKFMHCGFVALEPQTGHVKAWVGDIDFTHWKYDKVLSKRQPGSTFKLFVYTAAMNQGMSPCHTRVDQYTEWVVSQYGNSRKWTPQNANRSYSGATLSLKGAFARSVNTIAVQLAKEVGIHNIARTAQAMGVKTPLEEIPALALGASDVSLLELVNSYSTVMNDGQVNDPVLVTKIEDRNGNVIYSHPHTYSQAIPYESAFLMQQMLMGGMTEPGGTSRALWGYDVHNYETNFGGKTGTSSNYSDAWFVGVTKNLVAGAWVGGERRTIRFRTSALGQGSRTALPIYGYFMEKVLKDHSLKQYRGMISSEPKYPINRDYKCAGYYIATEEDVLANDSILFHLVGIGEMPDVPDLQEESPVETDAPASSNSGEEEVLY